MTISVSEQVQGLADKAKVLMELPAAESKL